ncbi:hypothetical protein OCU04_007811 [Sclerotinia nivalis]|uniref:Uncharacterized protein n=1 Tax=Sclerotinia nivalis TaxID=352851 RepID=A0A9X0AJJ3_9HELO|nr:hypothetical protein OCU04_007811 [Sclerotinia nivalis]
MNFDLISLVTPITAISSLTAPVHNLANLTTTAVPAFSTVPTIPSITPIPSSTPTIFPSSTSIPSSTPTIFPSPSQTPILHTPEITIQAFSLTGRFWTGVPLTSVFEGYTCCSVSINTGWWYASLDEYLDWADWFEGVERNSARALSTITIIGGTEIVMRDMGVGFAQEVERKKEQGKEGFQEGVEGDVGEVSWVGDGVGEEEVEMAGDATNGTEQRICTNESMTTSPTMGMSAESNDSASVSPSNLPTDSTTMTATGPSNPTSEYPPQTSANASNPGASQCSSLTNRFAVLALVKDNTRRNPNAGPNDYQTSLLDNIESHLNSEDAGDLRHAVNGEPDLDEGSDTDGDGGKDSSSDEGSDSGSGPDDGPESDPDDNERPYEKYRRLNPSSDDGDDYDDEGDSTSDSDPPSDVDVDMDIYPSEIDEELLDEFWGLQGETKSSDDQSSEDGRDLDVSVKDVDSTKRRRGSCATSDVFDHGLRCVFGLDRGLGTGVPCGKRRKIFDGDVDADAKEMLFGDDGCDGFDFCMKQEEEDGDVDNDDFICKE